METEIKRKIKKAVTFGIAGLIVLSGAIYYAARPDPLPRVNTTELTYGDISSRMMVRALIKPGEIREQNLLVNQKVLEVFVSSGDQVTKGDLIAVLDISEAEERYLEAKRARKELEAQRAHEENLARQREKESAVLERRLEEKTFTLGAAAQRLVANVSLLTSLSPLEYQGPEDIGASIEDILFSSNDTQEIISELISLFTEEISLNENPERINLISEIQRDLNTISGLIPEITGILPERTANLVSSAIDLSPEVLYQLDIMGITFTDPLARAIADEHMYREMFENAVTEIRAEISGIVADIKLVAGEYFGPVQNTGSNGGLEDILAGLTGFDPGGLIPQSSQAAVVIFDNINPLATFRVSQFDASRIQTGMEVDYEIEGMTFNGEVIYKSGFVPDIGFERGQADDILGSIGMVTGAGTEPQLDVEMSISGEDILNLTLGFLIDARIRTATAENVLILPAQAMRREVDMYYVFVTDDEGNVKRKTFTPGIQSDMFVEIKDGLDENDMVILNPPANLEEGMAVEVTEVVS